MAEFMKAKQTIVFGTVDGPGAILQPGEEIPVEKVNVAYLETVRNGVWSDRAEVVEHDEEGHGQVEVSKEVDKPGESNSGLYDPSAHKVDEVLEYLKTASEDEVQRVKDAELNTKSSGRPSARVAAFKPEG